MGVSRTEFAKRRVFGDELRAAPVVGGQAESKRLESTGLVQTTFKFYTLY